MSNSLWSPWAAACQASLSITHSRSLLKLVSIESVMPSNCLILCRPLLLLLGYDQMPSYHSGNFMFWRIHSGKQHLRWITVGVTEEIHKSGSILRLLESTDWPELQAMTHRCFFGPPIRKSIPHFLLPLTHLTCLCSFTYMITHTHTHTSMRCNIRSLWHFCLSHRSYMLSQNCLPSLLRKCSCNLSQSSFVGRILFLRLDCTRTVRMPGNRN